VAMGMMYLVNLTGTLRVSREGELEGLDIHEHGIPAYPEYVIAPSATPSRTESAAELGRTDRYEV